MKGKKLVTLIASICLILFLVTSVLLSACAKPAAPTAAPAPTVIKPAPTTPGQTAPVTIVPTIPAPATTTPAPKPAAQVYKWRLQSHVAPGVENNLIREVSKNIETMSGGRIVITVFDGGALVPVEDEFTAMKTGVVEFCRASGTYYLGFVPEGDIEGGIPFMWRNLHDVETLWYDRGLGDLMQQAYNEQGAEFMSLGASAPFCFWTKKEITGVDGLKGLKIRSFGLYMEVLKSLGAAATFIAHAETYTSLATGVVDGSSTAAYVFQDLKNYEICKHYYADKWGMPTNDIIMNKKTYDGLSADLKAILKWGLRQDMYNQDRVYVNIVTKMEANMTKDWGVTLHRWSTADLAKMTAAALPFYDKYAAKSPRMAKMIDIIKTYMKEVGYIQ